MPTHRTDRRAAPAGLLVAALLSFGLVAPAMAAGAPPTVDGTSPSDGDANVALDAAIAVFFSETVNVADGWFTLVCTTSGTHSAAVIPSGAGFVFLPDQAFVPNESCTFTVIAAFVTDREDPPTAMAADFAFSFTTIEAAVPDNAPTVVGTAPVDGAVDVALASDISITFSEPVAVAGSWFSIVCDKSGMHAAGVSGGPTTYTIDPSADFVSGESCRVTIDADHVSDEDTNDPPDTMASDAIITFSTAAPPDQAPTVTSMTPEDGAADVAVGSDLHVTFSEPVDVAGSWFDLSCATSGAHTATVSGGPTTFTLNPDSDFAPSEGCTLTVVASQVTDQDANDPPDAMVGNAVVGFTTAAPPDEAPTVTSTSPTDGDADIATGTNLQVTFSEPVDVSGSWYTIACDASGPHAAVVGGGPQTFTLDPVADFAPSEGCSLTILAQDVTDQDTNDPPNAMANDVIVSFTTAAPPDDAPSVVSTTPTDGAADVDVDANVQITFSEPVDVAGTWFTLSCGTSGAHAAVVSGGPTTYVLDPTVDFAENELCVANIVAKAVTDRDQADPPDAMAADFGFTFTTADLNGSPTVDAGGPYAVVEGGSVTLTATGTDPDDDALTYAWDVDGNGTFETPGASLVFSAAGLQAPLTRTVRVQVSDPGGLTGTDVASVDVIWGFGGFRPPLGDGATPNAVNAGSTVPVKFTLAGNQGLSIFKPGYPASASYDCGTVPPTEANVPAVPSDAFRYDRNAGEYAFTWKTDKAWAGTCRVLVLGLSDGTTHAALFQFKKGTEQSNRK